MKLVFSAAFAALAISVLATPAQAATYNVITSQSTLTLSGLNASGFQFGGQGGAADLVASFQGTVEATVSPGLVITFNGGSVIDALANPNAPVGGYVPLFGGFVPSEASSPLAGGDYVFADGSPDPIGAGDGVFSVGEDNYGITGIGFAAPIKSAIRNFAVDLTGGGTANDAVADAQSMQVINGWYAIDLGGAGAAFSAEDATEVWAGQNLGVTVSGDLGYSLIGNLETITIPYQKSFQAFGVLNATISGTIVAVRVIPEPTSGLFLASLAAGACGVIRRRRK